MGSSQPLIGRYARGAHPPDFSHANCPEMDRQWQPKINVNQSLINESQSAPGAEVLSGYVGKAVICVLQDGVSRMSLQQIRPQPTLLSELALTLVGTFAVSLPMAVAIIWICS